jgi:DNA repair photolyase
MVPRVNIIKAKTILTKSGLPGADYVINPYNGCLFGCMYCYASQIARWKHPNEEWGTYVDVKENAFDLLKLELIKMEKKLRSKNFGSIFFSSITDPYVGIEAKYKITRKCLETLADFGYEGNVSLQTKSPLITRDIDILKKLKNISVGFTVTTLDDKVSRFLEVMAPPVSDRIKALQELHEAGISTYAFVGPLLPYFNNSSHKINELLDELQRVGVKKVWFEHINLNPRIKNRLFTYLEKKSPQLIKEFSKADDKEYRDQLEEVIQKAMKGRDLEIGLGKIIYHKEL